MNNVDTPTSANRALAVIDGGLNAKAAFRRCHRFSNRNCSVNTTMIYTHVLSRGGKGVHSPADRLGFDSARP